MGGIRWHHLYGGRHPLLCPLPFTLACLHSCVPLPLCRGCEDDDGEVALVLTFFMHAKEVALQEELLQWRGRVRRRGRAVGPP